MASRGRRAIAYRQSQCTDVVTVTPRGGEAVPLDPRFDRRAGQSFHLDIGWTKC